MNCEWKRHVAWWGRNFLGIAYFGRGSLHKGIWYFLWKVKSHYRSSALRYFTSSVESFFQILGRVTTLARLNGSLSLRENREQTTGMPLYGLALNDALYTKTRERIELQTIVCCPKMVNFPKVTLNPRKQTIQPNPTLFIPHTYDTNSNGREHVFSSPPSPTLTRLGSHARLQYTSGCAMYCQNRAVSLLVNAGKTIVYFSNEKPVCEYKFFVRYNKTFS